MLIWADVNGKSELCFSGWEDERGRMVAEFIGANGLYVLNREGG